MQHVAVILMVILAFHHSKFSLYTLLGLHGHKEGGSHIYIHTVSFTLSLIHI